MSARIAELESRFARRIGLYARNLRTGRTLSHRPDERFAMCSTFKTLAVAAVLDGRLLTPDPQVLRRRACWPPSLVAGAGYAVRMEEWQRAAYRPEVAEVCEAALVDSDNAAGNWLLGVVGGPAAITRLARDLGDPVTDLTRWEPDLNRWVPGATRDTTTPRAMGRGYAALLAGRALVPSDRRRLHDWMAASRTGGKALRAGLPDGWRIAEKTGSGDFGTRNDVGVAWTPDGTPVVISCLTHGLRDTDGPLDAVLAAVGQVCGETLG